MSERKAWAHQERGIPIATRQRRYLFFWEMGTGKTWSTIQVLRGWYGEEKRLLRTIIFGPPIVLHNWAREIDQFSKVGKHVVVLEGTGAKRLKLFEKHKDKPTIFVTNYESLSMKPLYQAMQEWSPSVIVFDEIHRLKSHNAVRTKLAKNLSRGVPRKIGLTGSPVTNNPMELFSIVGLIDDGKIFGDNFFLFRANYFYDKNAGMPKDKHFPKWVLRPGSDRRFNEMLQPISSVAIKSQCLDLPPLVKKKVFVPLAPAQKKAYEDLKKDFIAYVGDKACVAELAMTKALRMQQVLSGFIPLQTMEGETSVEEFKENPRAEALESILEELHGEHKIIIWAVFKQNYKTIRDICARLKISLVEVHGEIAASEKQSAVDSFNTDPKVRVFLGHPMSGGIGINLVAAAYSIFYSRNFSLEQDLQAESRNYRGGSEMHEKITRIDLVAEGTLDEQVMNALADKKSVADAILNGIKEL